MSRLLAELLGSGEAAHEVAALSFAADVCVDGEDSAGFVAEVLGDLVHGRAQPQPGGRGVVPEVVAGCSTWPRNSLRTWLT